MSKAPAVVLDTNVVLSALLFAGGALVPLRDAWHRERCRPLVSEATVSELIRALAHRKFKLSSEERGELLADYLPYCTIVRMPRDPPPVPRCRDPFDRQFLELAAVGGADYLVTGDKDLLDLSGRFACPIMTPERFLALLPKP